MAKPLQRKVAAAKQKVSTAKKAVKGIVKPVKSAVNAVKYGQRLTGRTAVPNLKAMRAKKIITTMD